MRVRDHLRQHDRVKELPLVTESATVTEVAALDRSRNDAVVRELLARLDDHGTEAWRADRPASDRRARQFVRETLDAADHLEDEAPLTDYLPPRRRRGTAGERLAALQERYLRPYPSLLKVVVETDASVDFAAGQYFAVRYGETARVYSAASSPNRGEVEFCIRRVPGGELTGELAVHLDPGDEVTLRGPYGDLLLEDPSRRDAVFLATGTGVAPFRSMVDYLFEEGWDVHRGHERDVWLFLGAGWEDDLAYRERFRELARERSNFHFVPTCSREPALTDWTGETAYVQRALVKYVDDDALAGVDLPAPLERYRDEDPAYDVPARLHPDSMEVYACGLNAMVAGLVSAVRRLGVPERHTAFEGFG